MNVWKGIFLFFIVAGAAWGGYTLYNRATTISTTTSQRQLVQTTRGSLQSTVTATGTLTMPQQAKLSFGVVGTILSEAVKVGDQVQKGQVLARLDTTQLEQAMTQAQVALDTAQIQLRQISSPYTSQDVAEAQATIVSSEANMAAAQSAFEKAQNPYTDVDVAQAEGAIRDAQAALDSANRQLAIAQSDTTYTKDVRDRQNEANYYEVQYGNALADLKNGKVNQDQLNQQFANLQTAKEKLAVAQQKLTDAVANAQNNIARAEDNLKKAQDNLNTIRAGGDPSDIQQKQAALVNAQNAQQKAVSSLAKIQAGADPNDVKKADNAVLTAQLNLDKAKQQLEQAVMTAPFDGIIAQVNTKVGETVQAGTQVFLLVDPGQIEVDAAVDEIDVSKLSVGQDVNITLDAIAGSFLEGKVVDISLTATRQSGVVSYPIVISVEPNTQLTVRDGMTATPSIVTQRVDNALLVPNRAIKTSGGTKTVQVMVDGKAEMQTVRTGLSNDQYTEITSGLKDGDVLVVETGVSSGTIRVPGGVGGVSGIGGPPVP